MFMGLLLTGADPSVLDVNRILKLETIAGGLG